MPTSASSPARCMRATSSSRSRGSPAMSARPRWIGGAIAWRRRRRSSWRSSGSHWRRTHGRASATWIENHPNARGNVANLTLLHCDVRHERPIAPRPWRRSCGRRWRHRRATARAIEHRPLRNVRPGCVRPGARGVAARQGGGAPARHARHIAAAGHDSVLIAPLCPSAMLFVPSVDGITHNPREILHQGAAGARRAGAAGRGAGAGAG